MIVHETPGLLDMQALTVMGLSAKPNTKSPIGMFGTGLKYAVAVLCRLGASPVLWIGEESHTFTVKKAKFRDSEYSVIRCRVDRPGLLKPRYYSLPFTTQYGKFWEPWMVFRELHSNTLDEQGTTRQVFGPAERGEKGWTKIVVDLPAYDEAWESRDTVFLPNATRNTTGLGPDVEVLAEGSREFLFWRGLRVAKLNKPAVATWNMLRTMELTEDRTLKYEFMYRHYVAAWLAAHCRDAKLIEDCITADLEHWEHRLPFQDCGVAPSELFKQVGLACGGKAPGVTRYIGRYLPSTAKAKTEWEKAPRPWFVNDLEDPTAICASDGRELLWKPPSWLGNWGEFAEALCKVVNAKQDKPVAAVDNADDIPF